MTYQKDDDKLSEPFPPPRVDDDDEGDFCDKHTWKLIVIITVALFATWMYFILEAIIFLF